MRVMMAMSSFCSSSSTCSEGGHVELRRGPWTLDEDTLLIHYIASNGEGRWNLLAKRSGLRRTGKSCRLRWLNYLKPDVKHGNLSPQEQLLIIELHSKWGNRWSKIAQHLPGRTDNEIKNYWRTRMQKQAKHLRIDSNSTAFQDILRCIWIPRLLQKIEKTSSSSASSSSSSPSAISSQDSIILQSFYQDSDYQFPPPPQPPPQQLLPDLGASNMTMSSTSQIPQLSEHSTSPFHALVTSLKDCYYLDNINYDMENFNLATMPAAVQPDDIHYPISDCHVEESNWVDNDLAECLWNLT